MSNLKHDDEPDIPAALSAEEWAQASGEGIERIGFWARVRRNEGAFDLNTSKYVTSPDRNVAGDDVVGIIALANAALHDEDPRKIRREHVQLLRDAAKIIDEEVPENFARSTEYQAVFDGLHELADALESYLPPVEAKAETPTDDS